MTIPFEKLISSTLRCGVENEKLISIRKSCRENVENVLKLAEILLENVVRDDVRIRLNCILVADDIFSKSHLFREKIVENLQTFLLCTIETDPLHYPIVGPKDDVKRLKSTSLTTVYKWTNTYGKFYRKLHFALDFLKTLKTVDLDRLEAETIVERQRKLAAIERQNNFRRKTTEDVEKDFQENKLDFEICIKELENGLELLIPKNVDDSKSLFEQHQSTNLDDLSKHGFLHKRNNSDFSVEISLINKIPIVQCEDNVDLLKNLADSYKLLKCKHLPKIDSYLKRLTKSGVLENHLVKSLVNFRQNSNVLLKKYEELKFLKPNFVSRSFSSDPENDDEFIPVEDLNVADRQQNVIGNLPINDEALEDISTNLDEKNPNANDNVRGSTIPKLKFGIDFYDDDNACTSTSLVRNDSDSHRFWRPVADGDQDDGVQKRADILNRRKFTFQTDFVPVQHKCGALMSDGISRCERKDRERCPFHGQIGGSGSTNETCGANKPMTSSAISKSAFDAESSSWKDVAFNDPVLINDIEIATGIKLTDNGGDKKGNKRKSKQAAFNKPVKTSRDRLLRKFSNRSSLKRVNTTLDTADKKKICDKFSHQWNYAVNS